ncbi:MAG: NUDIX domain-containing protein [Candidatus Shapirobacteria bacterium]
MNKTDIHPIQSKVLCELLFVQQASFSELKKMDIGTDLFSFHLRQLTDLGLVSKTEKGKYCLTTKGKEYANRFDTEATEVERQPKIGVLIIGVKNENGQTKYLMQQRLKQPYFGFWGFVTGKIRWGEKFEETALRELGEETGLKGKCELVGIEHKTDLAEDGTVLEDKVFVTFKATELKGELQENFEGGKNQWMSKTEIEKLTEPFDDVEAIIEDMESGIFWFRERSFKVKRY